MTSTSKALFYLLLALSVMIEKTFQAGEYYRENLHHHVMKYSKLLVTHFLTLCIIIGERVEHIYENREEYITKLKEYQHKLEKAFVYESPVYG